MKFNNLLIALQIHEQKYHRLPCATPPKIRGAFWSLNILESYGTLIIISMAGVYRMFFLVSNTLPRPRHSHCYPQYHKANYHETAIYELSNTSIFGNHTNTATPKRSGTWKFAS